MIAPRAAVIRTHRASCQRRVFRAGLCPDFGSHLSPRPPSFPAGVQGRTIWSAFKQNHDSPSAARPYPPPTAGHESKVRSASTLRFHDGSFSRYCFPDEWNNRVFAARVIILLVTRRRRFFFLLVRKKVRKK